MNNVDLLDREINIYLSVKVSWMMINVNIFQKSTNSKCPSKHTLWQWVKTHL